MPKLFDRVKVNIATTGTGTVTFGPASSPAFLTPAEAGAVDGNTVRYAIVDGTDFEEGVGTLLATVAQMSRDIITRSKIGGSLGAARINLSGTAVLVFTASAADILNPANNLSDVASAATARTNLGLGSAATQASSAFLQPGNNLSEVSSAATTRTNLGLGTSASPQFTAVELGHATDTTVLRPAAGRMQIEGEEVLTTKDLSSVLTSAQRKRVRESIGVERKNYIINGAMMISQENGQMAGITNGFYFVDQFNLAASGLSGVLSSAQVVSASPAGSPSRSRLTVTSPDASITSGKIAGLLTYIEGNRVADLMFGTGSAKTFTLKFGVKAPAGTYCVSFRNGQMSNRSYVVEFNVSAPEANTDVYRTMTVPGDVTGTWDKTTSAGLSVAWILSCGSAYQATAGTWQAGICLATSNISNFMGTNGNVFDIFDIGLYEGAVAPDFVVPTFANELRECQRYFKVYKMGNEYTAGLVSTLLYRSFYFDEMRAIPTATMISSTAGIAYLNTGSNTTPTTFTLNPQTTTHGYVGIGVANIAGHTSFNFSLSARM